MPSRLFPLLTLAIALFITGGAIVSLADHSAGPADSDAMKISATDPVPTSIPLLPTVVVRPEPEIPTLATVTVRPDRIEQVAVHADRDGKVDRPLALARAGTVATLPGGGFDMPYYSFAKTLRRANKE